MWNGFLVAKLKVQPIVATMILLTAGRGIAQLISDGKIVTITSDAYYFISGGYLLGLPIPFFIAMFVVALVLLLTKRTAFGLAVESIGVNADSSRLAGIKVERNLWLIYILCGTLAALSGLIESAGIKGADCNNCGLMIEMDGILAVAIGGTSFPAAASPSFPACSAHLSCKPLLRRSSPLVLLRNSPEFLRQLSSS